MKILYVANIRFPTEKAHGIQIMKICEAFKLAGHDVELIVPSRSTQIKTDPFDYYAIKTKFPIRRLLTLDLTRYGRLWFYVQTAIFSISAFVYTFFRDKDIVFGRDEAPLLLISFHSKVVWETHTGGLNMFTKLLLNRKPKIISITQGLKDFYVNNGVKKESILVAPDGVDARQFDIPISKEEARNKVSLPQDKKIVLYTGHLYDWKGAHILAEAANFLPKDTSVVFVGGTEKDVESFKKRFGSIQNVSILGRKPYASMPLYMKAADVLTLPNSPVNDISSLYTSPMKLFEYMASNRPIVASDLPSIREILNESNSVLVIPDNPKLLADGIAKALNDSDFAKLLSDRSYSESKQYIWRERAESILLFIKA